MLRCPRCHYEWHAATIQPERDHTTPEAIAKVPYCPQCEAPPPMTVVGLQGELFG